MGRKLLIMLQTKGAAMASSFIYTDQAEHVCATAAPQSISRAVMGLRAIEWRSGGILHRSYNRIHSRTEEPLAHLYSAHEMSIGISLRERAPTTPPMLSKNEVARSACLSHSASTKRGFSSLTRVQISPKLRLVAQLIDGIQS